MRIHLSEALFLAADATARHYKPRCPSLRCIEMSWTLLALRRGPPNSQKALQTRRGHLRTSEARSRLHFTAGSRSGVSGGAGNPGKPGDLKRAPRVAVFCRGASARTSCPRTRLLPEAVPSIMASHGDDDVFACTAASVVSRRGPWATRQILTVFWELQKAW